MDLRYSFSLHGRYNKIPKFICGMINKYWHQPKWHMFYLNKDFLECSDAFTYLSDNVIFSDGSSKCFYTVKKFKTFDFKDTAKKNQAKKRVKEKKTKNLYFYSKFHFEMYSKRREFHLPILSSSKTVHGSIL